MFRTILVAAIALCLTAPVMGAAPMHYYDDGDALFNAGYIDYDGTGRPASGSAYDGTKYLSVLGDPVRGSEGTANYCRNGDRVSAFVTNDYGLGHSADWKISMDVQNDWINPDYGMDMWLVDFNPNTAGAANAQSWPAAQTTFWFRYWDQKDDPPNTGSTRGGFVLSYWTPGGRVDESRENSAWWNTLDPVPGVDDLQGDNHNYVTVEWFAASGDYVWTISNLNGTMSRTINASALAISPATTYFMLGNVAGGTTGGATGDGGLAVASGFTINGLDYVPEPGSLCVLGTGILGLAGFIRRRK